MTDRNRKNEHIALAEKYYQDSRTDFDDLRFVHHSFPNIGTSDIDLSTTFASFLMELPIYINAMTGGSEATKKINEKLAIVARETNLAMGTGSLSIILKDPLALDSFKIIREVNPKGILFANLGAGKSLEDAKRVVDLINADALQIHINAPQELIMPEGDRDFTNWIENIETIVTGIDVPVIVKEVGFGMSSKTIKQLIDIGVKQIDISGRGGTNFAQIENNRRLNFNYDFLEDWGQSTVISLLEASPFINDIDILASGGIRHPLDIIKALSLGAKAVGVAGHFLHLVLKEGVENTIKEVFNWKDQINTIMTLLGIRTIDELKTTDLVISGQVKDWCESREIDLKYYANRKK